jgi:hypothetical protein
MNRAGAAEESASMDLGSAPIEVLLLACAKPRCCHLLRERGLRWERERENTWDGEARR